MKKTSLAHMSFAGWIKSRPRNIRFYIALALIPIIFIGLGYIWGNGRLGAGGKNADTNNSSSSSLNPHAQHLQMAQQNQQPAGGTAAGASNGITGSLKGDASRRYTVSFNHPAAITPGAPTPLSFEVFNASNGNRADAFQTLYEKAAHLVIVDDELTYYDHIHPRYNEQSGALEAEAIFPKAGNYRLYINYQPLGAIEQQVGFSLKVGDAGPSPAVAASPDTKLTKTFGAYMVTLATATYQADKLSRGEQTVKFSLKTAQGKPVTNLKPYLGAFGHMVMINTATYDYTHVHPKNTAPPSADATSGPDVEFVPLGLYGAITPGTYRIFLQTNPDGNVMLSDFTVKIE